MNYKETLDWIHGTERFGSQLGLTRMRELLQRLGDPHKSLICIHVAGTNGKGSTTTMIASVLQEAGFKTGKYISPFILEFRERMQINGQMIPPEALCTLGEKVRAASEEMARDGMPPTEFELVTAIGFLWFAAERCDIVVLEVGLGGRLDATNVIEAPLAAVITRIDYDHTAILGNTLTAIAGEKCGIIKPGSRVICYPDQAEEALQVIRCRTAEEGNELVLPDRGKLRVCEESLSGSRIEYREIPVMIPLAGGHQIWNALTAIETLRALAGTRFAVSPAQIAAGIAAVHFPARLEVFHSDPPVLLDGAHNPNGGASLMHALDMLGLHQLTAVAGMLRDKDSEPVLRMIAPYCERIITTTVDNPRTLSAQELGDEARKYCRSVTVLADNAEAVREALRHGENGIVIFGSLYLASSVRPMLCDRFGEAQSPL